MRICTTHIKMYKKTRPNRTTIRLNQSIQGESIETKVERITQNKEPIKDGAPLIYTDRKDGVQPEYDIRTDRFEIAAEAKGKIAKMDIAKREQRVKERESGKTDGGPEPIGGTTTTPDVK